MFIKENIMLAIAGLKSNKMRSLLTMLGIIIGISSVISIISIGNAITANLASAMSDMGANNIMCGVYSVGDSQLKEPTDNDLFSMEQLDSLKQVFSDKIQEISLEERVGSGSAKEGYSYANVSIQGVNSGYKATNNIDLIKGRFISEKDVKGNKKTAVVSDKLINSILKKETNPLGKEIKVYTGNSIETYSIVGIYKYKSSMFEPSMNSEKDIFTDLYTPITTAKLVGKNKNYSRFTIKTKVNVDSKKFVEDLEKYFKKLYKSNKDWKAFSYNMENEVETMTKVFGVISLGISVIAAISLLVGGIGVMNIMLVSVTERTREIGTRKALGAKSSYIKMQFITESVIICAIGGIIGIIFGIGTGIIACILLKAPISISISTILISFTFSMAIGVFFGYYPAKKAAKLDPIEALRYE